MKEWLDIRNKIVRPNLVKLKEKKSSTVGQSLEKTVEFAPEPMRLPAERPVEFAPEPTGTFYWPLITKHREWNVVSYRFGPKKGDIVKGTEYKSRVLCSKIQ